MCLDVVQLSPTSSPSWVIALLSSIVLCAGLAANAVSTANDKARALRLHGLVDETVPEEPCSTYNQRGLRDAEYELSIEVMALEDALLATRNMPNNDVVRRRLLVAEKSLEQTRASLEGCRFAEGG